MGFNTKKCSQFAKKSNPPAYEFVKITPFKVYTKFEKPIFQPNFKFWQNLDNCANIFAIQHTRQVQFPKALWLQQALDPSYMCIASSEIQLAWISFRGTWCSALLLGCVQKIDFCETSRWVFHLGNNSVCSRRNTNFSFSDRFLLVWINHVHLTKIFKLIIGLRLWDFEINIIKSDFT